MEKIRVKWHIQILKGLDEDKIPILEEGEEMEGTAIAVIPYIGDSAYRKGSADFVILMDDNTFVQIPISMCKSVADTI